MNNGLVLVRSSAAPKIEPSDQHFNTRAFEYFVARLGQSSRHAVPPMGNENAAVCLTEE